MLTYSVPVVIDLYFSLLHFAMMVMMMLSKLFAFDWINYLKMRHHTSFMMFKNMAMVHPLAGPIVGHPGNFHLTSRLKINGIFPCFVGRRFSIFFKNLEEKSMQVKRVIHQTCVGNFPHLQFSYVYGLIICVHITVYQKINSMFPAWPNRKFYFPCAFCDANNSIVLRFSGINAFEGLAVFTFTVAYCACFGFIEVILLYGKDSMAKFSPSVKGPANISTLSPGDCYLVYPGGNSCIRFEKLREGIVDYEKIRIIKELAANSSDASVKNLVAALDAHLQTLNDEKTFNEEKLKGDIVKGRAMINELSEKLSGRNL